MATIDQDNFSNISWHSEHNNGQGSSRETPSRDAPSAGDPEQAPAEGPAERAAPAVPREDLEFDLGGEVLECTVSEPHKENDGTKDAYVSYLITTHSTFPSFQKPTTTVRRRFTDFVFLYKALSKDYQAAAVPPLPDKQRMEYVRGDRFGPDFTLRRAHSLQRFLTRLTLHPVLRRAPIFHTFLESHDWNATMRARAARGGLGAGGSSAGDASGGGGGGVFDAFADSFINAFTKVHRPDRRFIEVKERADKLDEDLGHVEKVMVRVARREADLETDLRELAEQFQKLIVLEPGVEPATHAFAASVEDTAAGLKRLRDATDGDYIGSLRDMTAYSQALKNLLKAREQKQLDYEQLTEYLNKSTADRDALAATLGGGAGAGGAGGGAGYHHQGYAAGALGGAGGFLRSKLEDVRGVDHEQSRRDRQRKLELRVDELTREVEAARHEAERFGDMVVHEVATFDRVKRIEFKRQLAGLADAHVGFFDGVERVWERYVEEMEREGVVLPA